MIFLAGNKYRSINDNNKPCDKKFVKKALLINVIAGMAIAATAIFKSFCLEKVSIIFITITNAMPHNT